MKLIPILFGMSLNSLVVCALILLDLRQWLGAEQQIWAAILMILLFFVFVFFGKVQTVFLGMATQSVVTAALLMGGVNVLTVEYMTVTCILYLLLVLFAVSRE